MVEEGCQSRAIEVTLFPFFSFLQLTTYNDVLGEGRPGLWDESARRGLSHMTQRAGRTMSRGVLHTRDGVMYTRDGFI